MPLNHTSQYAELTDNQFLLIGKLAVEFSSIEFLLSVVLSRLLITPSFLSRTYTERMNVSALTEKIKNALDIHDRRYSNTIIPKDLCELIKNQLSEIEKVRLIRNKFAHYCWCRHSDEEIFGTGFLGKQAKFDKHNKHNEDAIVISNIEIENLYKTSYKIVGELDKIIEALPELLEDNELKNKLSYK